MPSKNWELDKEEFIKFDPDSYYILSRIVDNGLKYEELNKAISENIIKKGTNFSKILSDNDYAFVGKTTIDVENKKPQTFDYFTGKKDDGEINKRMFYPKWRQTRIPFYQIEQALHYQLRQLLIPDPDKEEVPFLKGIYDDIRYLCLPEGSSKDKEDLNLKFEKEKKVPPKNWDDVFPSVINELRIHIILELLMYFYHEDEHKGR